MFQSAAGHNILVNGFKERKKIPSNPCQCQTTKSKSDMAATNDRHLKIKLRVQNTNYSCWTNNHVESQLFFSPWYNHHGWLTVKKQLSMYLFPWVSTVFHPDITIMVDWLLKNNYLSIYPHWFPLFFTLI